MYKAVLDENNICIGLCNNSPLIAEGIVVDYDVTGMRYDNGVWVEVETVYKPTEQEIIQAEILLNQAKILAKLNQLEV